MTFCGIEFDDYALVDVVLYDGTLISYVELSKRGVSIENGWVKVLPLKEVVRTCWVDGWAAHYFREKDVKQVTLYGTKLYDPPCTEEASRWAGLMEESDEKASVDNAGDGPCADS
jgi:hypothetical protein